MRRWSTATSRGFSLFCGLHHSRSLYSFRSVVTSRLISQTLPDPLQIPLDHKLAWESSLGAYIHDQAENEFFELISTLSDRTTPISTYAKKEKLLHLLSLRNSVHDKIELLRVAKAARCLSSAHVNALLHSSLIPTHPGVQTRVQANPNGVLIKISRAGIYDEEAIEAILNYLLNEYEDDHLDAGKAELDVALANFLDLLEMEGRHDDFMKLYMKLKSGRVEGNLFDICLMNLLCIRNENEMLLMLLEILNRGDSTVTLTKNHYLFLMKCYALRNNPEMIYRLYLEMKKKDVDLDEELVKFIVITITVLPSSERPQAERKIDLSSAYWFHEIDSFFLNNMVKSSDKKRVAHDAENNISSNNNPANGNHNSNDPSHRNGRFFGGDAVLQDLQSDSNIPVSLGSILSFQRLWMLRKIMMDYVQHGGKWSLDLLHIMKLCHSSGLVQYIHSTTQQQHPSGGTLQNNTEDRNQSLYNEKSTQAAEILKCEREKVLFEHYIRRLIQLSHSQEVLVSKNSNLLQPKSRAGQPNNTDLHQEDELVDQCHIYEGSIWLNGMPAFVDRPISNIVRGTDLVGMFFKSQISLLVSPFATIHSSAIPPVDGSPNLNTYFHLTSKHLLGLIARRYKSIVGQSHDTQITDCLQVTNSGAAHAVVDYVTHGSIANLLRLLPNAVHLINCLQEIVAGKGVSGNVAAMGEISRKYPHEYESCIQLLSSPAVLHATVEGIVMHLLDKNKFDKLAELDFSQISNILSLCSSPVDSPAPHKDAKNAIPLSFAARLFLHHSYHLHRNQKLETNEFPGMQLWNDRMSELLKSLSSKEIRHITRYLMVYSGSEGPKRFYDLVKLFGETKSVDKHCLHLLNVGLLLPETGEFFASGQEYPDPLAFNSTITQILEKKGPSDSRKVMSRVIQYFKENKLALFHPQTIRHVLSICKEEDLATILELFEDYRRTNTDYVLTNAIIREFCETICRLKISSGREQYRRKLMRIVGDEYSFLDPFTYSQIEKMDIM